MQPDASNPTQGQKLRAWMAHCGVNQSQLALLLNISNRQVNKWVTDRQEMKRSTLLRVLDVLNITLLDFESRTPPRKQAAPGFGERLATAMVERGFTHSDLAQRLGVHKSTVGRWVHDEREPGSDTLATVAEVLGTSAEYLRTGVVPVSRETMKWAAVTVHDFLSRNPHISTEHVGVLYTLFHERKLPAYLQQESFFRGFLELMQQQQAEHARKRLPS